MVYVGGIYGDWEVTANNFCDSFEKYFECNRPNKVKSYLQMLETKRKSKEAKERKINIENKRLRNIRLKEAGIEYDKVLKHRCEVNKITPTMVKEAFDGKDVGDPCNIYSQLRVWFRGMDLSQSLKLCSR